MFFPEHKYRPPVFSNEGREPGRYFQHFYPAKHVIDDDELERTSNGVVVIPAAKLAGLVADARRYRFLTSGDRSITVFENDGKPVGFFCGTREEVSEQIDGEMTKEEHGKEE